MLMNRAQFQPGMSMREFQSLYGTDGLCEAGLIARRWPRGFECPRCGVCEARTSFERQGRRYWHCAGCQYQCSALSGTIFDSSKLPLKSWFLAMQLLTQSKADVSALELMRHLGVCYRTAWRVKHKILEGMRLAEADRQLIGRVEIDEAYLGGERSGGKASRGSENQVPFVTAVQTTEDGLPDLACLSPRPFTNRAMEEFLARHTALPLTLVSDGLNCFQVAASAGAVHDREITGGGKASVLNGKFMAVNTLIGNVKTALTGSHHAIKFAKYAYRDLTEVQFRFNRRYDLRAIFSDLLVALGRAPRRPLRRIRVAELHRRSGPALLRTCQTLKGSLHARRSAIGWEPSSPA